MADGNSLIRVGKVSSINTDTRKARVFYPSLSNMVSDWLPVLQFRSGTWMPKVNDKVLVIMECGFNSGGYIVGVIP